MSPAVLSSHADGLKTFLMHTVPGLATHIYLSAIHRFYERYTIRIYDKVECSLCALCFEPFIFC